MCGKEKISKVIQWQDVFSPSGSIPPAPAFNNSNLFPTNNVIYFTSELETWYIKQAFITWEILNIGGTDPINFDQETLQFQYSVALHKHGVVDNRETPSVFSNLNINPDAGLYLTFNKDNQKIKFELDSANFSGVAGRAFQYFIKTTRRQGTLGSNFNFRIWFTVEIYKYK